MRKLGLCALLGAALGCSTALDLERARAVFAGPSTPPPPVLVEAPAASLPPIEGLRATSGELRRVPLKWDPALTSDVAGYAVERALVEGGPYQHITTVVGRFETSYTDRGRDLAAKHGSTMGAGDLGDGQTYFYRVRPFDAAGRLAPAEPAPVAGTTAAAPARPSGLTVYSHLPGQVALTWNPVEDPTVDGYVVYRSPSAQGGFLPVARLAGSYQTTWVDRGLDPLRVFYYRVAAVNQAGGEGDATPVRRGVTKPEPLPPTGLRVVEQRLGANVLGWEPNVEEDVAGYRLLRHRADGSETRVVEIPADADRAEDAAVGAGERVSYRLSAFDRDGLESELSQAVEVSSVDYGLVAEPGEGGVVVRWDPRVQEQLAETRVLRVGTFGEEELGRVREPRFVHRDADPGARIRYRLVGVRPDGQEAPPSAVVESRAAADATR